MQFHISRFPFSNIVDFVFFVWLCVVKQGTNKATFGPVFVMSLNVLTVVALFQSISYTVHLIESIDIIERNLSAWITLNASPDPMQFEVLNNGSFSNCCLWFTQASLNMNPFKTATCVEAMQQFEKSSISEGFKGTPAPAPHRSLLCIRDSSAWS